MENGILANPAFWVSVIGAGIILATVIAFARQALFGKAMPVSSALREDLASWERPPVPPQPPPDRRKYVHVTGVTGTQFKEECKPGSWHNGGVSIRSVRSSEYASWADFDDPETGPPAFKQHKLACSACDGPLSLLGGKLAYCEFCKSQYYLEGFDPDVHVPEAYPSKSRHSLDTSYWMADRPRPPVPPRPRPNLTRTVR